MDWDDRSPWWERFGTAVVVAVLSSLVVVTSASQIPADTGARAIDEAGIAIGVAAAWACLLRWVNPWLMLAVVGGLSTLYWAVSYTGGPALVSAPVALFGFGLVRSRRLLYLAAALMTGAPILARVLSRTPFEVGDVTALVAFIAAAILAAEAARQATGRRRAQTEVARRRHAQVIAEQQLGLARDLHDGLAHALTGIAVQASLIERTATNDPRGAASAARTIAASSRGALAELNRIVKSLRSVSDAPRAPERGLADLRELISQADGSGLRIQLRCKAITEGEQPVERQFAAYRVVQEALTNATRYAAGSNVEVDVDGRDGLRIRVRDHGTTGRSPVVPGSGHGLVGMRERVGATGGSLVYGPARPTGFEVQAQWPA